MAEKPEGYWERAAREPWNEWFPVKAVAILGVIFALIFVYGPLGGATDTENAQAGYRGTGMATIQNAEVYAAALATVDLYPEDEEPYAVEEGADIAGEYYENVQVLGHVSVDNFNRLMNAITQWVAPEQGCAYCHGEDGNFASDEYYPKVVARRMIQMTQNVNANWGDHVGAAGVNCYTCHRGLNVPEYIWFNEPADEGRKVLGWDNNQNHPNPRVQSASLPSNIFEKFLLEDNAITVISQQVREQMYPERGVKSTEWTFGLMVHMSASLGVNCAYCHNTRAMGQWDQGPPARTTAWYGIRMARELNNEYLAPLQPVYPEHRLGVTGDAPKANCSTCHQGLYKPLAGKDMISNWPELAAPAPAAQQQAMAN